MDISKVKSWINQVFIKATRLHIFTTAKIYQLNSYNKVNLCNRRVPVIAIIYASITITFSHPIRGIFFSIHVHNYTKINGLDLGKITSLPNSKNVFNLHASFQSSPKMGT